MALIPPFFLDAVVALGVNTDGNTNWIGTGFLVGRFMEKIDDQRNNYEVFLVTNKHVIDGVRRQGADTMQVRFDKEGGGPAIEITVNAKAEAWTGPEDDSLDVVVSHIHAPNLRGTGARLFYFQSDSNILTFDDPKAKALTEGDPCFVLGYPMGLIGGARNYVIVRHGVLARIRDAIADGAKEFLIDATVFPGNSGGPVVLRPEQLSIEGTESITAAYLIGIVKSYVSYQDAAISPQTGRTRVIFEENSGLSAVVPAKYIVEAIDRNLGLSRTPEPAPRERRLPVYANDGKSGGKRPAARATTRRGK